MDDSTISRPGQHRQGQYPVTDNLLGNDHPRSHQTGITVQPRQLGTQGAQISKGKRLTGVLFQNRLHRYGERVRRAGQVDLLQRDAFRGRVTEGLCRLRGCRNIRCRKLRDMHTPGFTLTQLVSEGAGILQHRRSLNTEGQADREHSSRNGNTPRRQHVTQRGRQLPQAKRGL